MEMIGPEQQRLLDRLFNDTNRRTLNFKFTPGERCTSAEDLCQQINLVMDQVENGQAVATGPVKSGKQRIDIRELAARL